MSEQKEHHIYEIKDVVLPRFKRWIFKCHNCGSLFVSTKEYYRTEVVSEACPFCGQKISNEQRIPLWEYNLIRWFRGDFHKTTEQKTKEFASVIEEKGGKRLSERRVITCDMCQFGSINSDKKTYRCRRHCHDYPADFFCSYGSVEAYKKPERVPEEVLPWHY